MKVIIFLISIVGMMFSSCENYTPIENNLYSCLEEQYYSLGIELEDCLDSIEQELIDQNILLSGSGKAKCDYYQKVINANEIPYIKTFTILEALQSVQNRIDYLSCVNDISPVDSVLFQNSKYFKLTEGV